MYDFVLTLVRNARKVLVHAETELAGQAPPVVLEEKQVLALGAATRRIDEAIDGPLDSPTRCRSTAEQIGRELYGRIFRDGVDELFRRSLAAARTQTAGLRLLVKAGHDPVIHELPWELLHDGRSFLSHSPATPVVRYLEQAAPVQKIAVEPPLRVLLTTASPREGEDGEEIDGRGEERIVRAALAPLGGRATFDVAHQVSAERLRHLLVRAQTQGRPYHVWHHAGHGQVTDFDFILGLTDPEGMLQRAGADQITPVLAACPGLRIAVLNVCHGAAAPGLATTLAQLDVPGVIGFRTSLFHDSARTFAKSFYSHLTSLPFESAAALARLALVDSGAHPLDWAQLLVFARTTGAQPVIAPAQARAEPRRAGRTVVRFGGNVKAKEVRNFGTISLGDAAAAREGDLEIDFDPHRLATNDLVQVGELQVSGQEIETYAKDLLALLTSRPRKK